jgi:hypothetical protein
LFRAVDHGLTGNELGAAIGARRQHISGKSRDRDQDG